MKPLELDISLPAHFDIARAQEAVEDFKRAAETLGVTLHIMGFNTSVSLVVLSRLP